VLAIVISLCCAVIRLNADLLNGPYSAESQKLVEFIKNPKLEIPNELKEKASEIDILRKGYSGTANEKESETYISLLKNNQQTLEAIIQAYKNNQDYLSQVAGVAILINNTDLYLAAIKQMPENDREIALGFGLGFLMSITLMQLDDPKTSGKDRADFNRSYEFSKKSLTSLVKDYPKLINETFLSSDNARSLLRRFNGNFTKEYLDFLINLGLNINNPVTKDKTVLDVIEKDLANALKPDAPDLLKSSIKDYEAALAYLKSKNAKHFAELTAAKGQK
jgi:hypothetical protein